MVAALESKWKKPSSCRVEIVFNYQPQLDCDNVPKLILDGMQGHIYDNDNCVDELEIKRGNGLRKGIVVKVLNLDPQAAPKKVHTYYNSGAIRSKTKRSVKVDR